LAVGDETFLGVLADQGVGSQRGLQDLIALVSATRLEVDDEIGSLWIIYQLVISFRQRAVTMRHKLRAPVRVPGIGIRRK
jgi:hypothetical protein